MAINPSDYHLEYGRREFSDILNRCGFWVIYARSDRRFPCIRCLNIDRRDARPDCETCFGTGYQTQLERWFTYFSWELNRPSPNNAPLTRVGINPMDGGFFFTRHTEMPAVGDRIFVVEWNRSRKLIASHDAQPTRLEHPFRVHFVEPNTASAAVYFTAHCQPITEAREQYENALLATSVSITRD